MTSNQYLLRYVLIYLIYIQEVYWGVWFLVVIKQGFIGYFMVLVFRFAFFCVPLCH